MTQATCQTCRYYDARFSGRVVSGAMQCRRYPAAIAKHWTDWCGEHTPASKTQAAEVGL